MIEMGPPTYISQQSIYFEFHWQARERRAHILSPLMIDSYRSYPVLMPLIILTVAWKIAPNDWFDDCEIQAFAVAFCRLDVRKRFATAKYLQKQYLVRQRGAFIAFMRLPVFALVFILTGGWMFYEIAFICASTNHEDIPKIEGRFGSRKSDQSTVDSGKQIGAFKSDYDDYSFPDPSPINSRVHAAPIQNNAQTPSPSPSSSVHIQRNSTKTLQFPSPAPH